MGRTREELGAGIAIGGGNGSRSWPKKIRAVMGRSQRNGSLDKNDSRIIPAPIVPITSKRRNRNFGSKDIPKFIMVNSTAMRIRPRRRSQRRVERGSVLLASCMATEVPARKTNAGAQKWVIQRVKKSRGVVTARLVGEFVRDQLSRKSRV